MCGAGRVGEAVAGEALEQEGHAFEAVAAVGETGVAEETDHGLIELHPRRRLRAVGRDRALGTLGRDRAGAVSEQQAGEGLKANRSSAPGARPSSAVAAIPVSEDSPSNRACAMPQRLSAV